MFKRILVAVDINHADVSSALIQRALELSNGQAESIDLLHVVVEIPSYVAAQIPDEIYRESHQTVQRELDRLVDEAHADVPMTTSIKSGKPWYQIVRAAQTGEADLIVLAAHDTSLADILLGSVANQLVRHAGCSVYLHRSGDAG